MSNNNYINCSIVPFPCCDQCSSVHSFTLQNFTKPKSAFSVKPFQIPNAKWTPVLINKIWYYKMHQKSSQVNSEQILTLYFKHPSFSANHLFQCCSKCQVMFFKSCPGPQWGLGDQQLYLKVWEDPRGLLFTFILEQNQQTRQLI